MRVNLFSLSLSYISYCTQFSHPSLPFLPHSPIHLLFPPDFISSFPPYPSCSRLTLVSPLLILVNRTYQLKADSQSEAESWVSALRQTQVSGLPLCDQKLTSNMVPIIVHKCLQFVESTGLDVEGLYRVSGEKAKIRRLILAFNQGRVNTPTI